MLASMFGVGDLVGALGNDDGDPLFCSILRWAFEQ